MCSGIKRYKERRKEESGAGQRREKTKGDKRSIKQDKEKEGEGKRGEEGATK